MPLYYSTGLLAADGTPLKAPTADGTVGQLLQTDGAGQMSFVSDLGSSSDRLGTVYATALNASGASTTGALTVNADGASAATVGTGANTAVAVQVAGSRTRFGYDGISAYIAGGTSKTISLFANDSVEVFRGSISGHASMSRILLGTITTTNAVVRHSTNALRVFNAADTAHGEVHSSALGLGTGTAPVVYLHPGASNEIEQRNGVNAQSHAIYGTYTSSTNYERLRLYTQTGGDHVIASEAGSGGGTVRAITFMPSANISDFFKITRADGTTLVAVSTAANGKSLILQPADSGSKSLVIKSFTGVEVASFGHQGQFVSTTSFQVGTILASPDSTESRGMTITLKASHNADAVRVNNYLGSRLAAITKSGEMIAASLGVFGVTPPAAQPATPVTLADVIAILQSYGLAA